MYAYLYTYTYTCISRIPIIYRSRYNSQIKIHTKKNKTFFEGLHVLWAFLCAYLGFFCFCFYIIKLENYN